MTDHKSQARSGLGVAITETAPHRFAMLHYDPDRYDPLVAPAREKPQIWRLILGALLALAVMAVFSQLIFGGAVILGGQDTIEALARGETTLATLLLLFSLLGLGLGTWAAARLLHGRRLADLIGPPRLALAQAARVSLAMLLLNAVLFTIFFLGLDAPLDANLPAATWLLLLPLSILALILQVGSEEVFFRGYLQSQLAARFRSPLLWLVVPAALFAAGHFAASIYGGNAISVALWAGAFGLIAGDLTARAGTLGPAIALHFFNNAIIVLFVSMDGMLSGLSLFKLPFGPEDEAALAQVLPLDFAALVVSWLAARLALRR